MMYRGRLLASPMPSVTLSDLHVHASNASLLKYDFLYSCAAVEKILANIPRRAVPLR